VGPPNPPVIGGPSRICQRKGPCRCGSSGGAGRDQTNRVLRSPCASQLPRKWTVAFRRKLEAFSVCTIDRGTGALRIGIPSGNLPPPSHARSSTLSLRPLQAPAALGRRCYLVWLRLFSRSPSPARGLGRIRPPSLWRGNFPAPFPGYNPSQRINSAPISQGPAAWQGRTEIFQQRCSIGPLGRGVLAAALRLRRFAPGNVANLGRALGPC